MSNIFKKIAVVATTLLVLGGLGFANGASAITTAELQAQISALLETIASLQTQLADMSGSTTTDTTISGCSISSFDRALKQGMTGDDVKCMQIVLNSDSATAIASSGVGSAGNETNYFGSLTKAAVVKFQNKYAADILATYGLTEGTGYVGTTTRAKLNSLLVVTTTTDTTTTDTTTTDTTTTDTTTDTTTTDNSVVDGTVEVSSVSISSANLAKGSVGVEVAAFQFSSGANATLDSIKLTRTGLGAATDYSNVYIYNGLDRLKSGRTISSESNTVEFTNIGLALTDGTSKTITVKVDVYSSAGTSNKNTLGVASLSDISVSGGILSGSALDGAEMTISSISIGTATVADGGTLTKPTIGATEAKVAKFKITAGNDSITFDSITLTQDGSINSSNLTNFVLKDSSGNVVATVTGIVNDKVTLVLDTPFAIGKVQNKTFSLYSTIGAAKTTDGIRFYLDETSDVVITDTKYNQGANVTNSLTSGTYAKCVGSSSAGTACASAGSLQGGAITLSDNGPSANTIGRDATNIELLNFGIVTTRNVTVRDYTIKLNDGTDKANTTVNGDTDTFVVGTSGSLTVTATTSFAVNDYIVVGTTGSAGSAIAGATNLIAKITGISGAVLTITPVAGTDLQVADTDLVSTVTKVTAIRLVNADTGAVLYSNSTNRYFYNGASQVSIDASDDFDLDTGTTYNLSLKVDISAYSSPDMELVGGFYLDTSNDVKERDVNQYITTTDIVPSSLDGKTMTIGASSLTVSKASLPVSDTKVKGTDDVDVLGIALNAGSASDIKITNLVVRFIAESSGATAFTGGTGDTRANSVVSAVNIYDGATKIAGPKNLTDSSWTLDTSGSYIATFDNLSYVIPAGTSQKLTVKADVVNTTVASLYLAATVDTDNDITAEDADGNSLSLTADTYGSINENSGSAALSDISPIVVTTISTSGTLSASVEGTSDQAIAMAGTSDVVMAKYKFSALDEAFTIEKLDVIADTSGTFTSADSGTDNDIVRVGIKNLTSGAVKWSNIVSGKASFSSLGITVPADANVYLQVLVDLNSISGGATSGDTPRLGISLSSTNTFRAVGVGSSVVKTYSDLGTITNESGVNAMTVRKTAPTIAKVSSSSQWSTGTNTLYKFTVAADAHEAVSLKRFALTVSGTQAGITGDTYELYRGNTDITSKVTIYDPANGQVEDSTNSDTISTSANVIYFVWDGTTEETISAGSTNTYEVKASVGGMTAAGYSVSAYIADDATVLGDTTGRTAIGGYVTTSGGIYHAASTAIAADDVRLSAEVSVVSTYAQTNTGAVTFDSSLGDGSDERLSYGAVTTGQEIVLTETGATSDIIGTITGSLVSTGGFTCVAYSAADGGGSATTTIADIQSIKCSNSTTTSQVMLDVDPVSATSTLVVTTITLTSGTYTRGSKVVAADSDVGLTSVASTVHNLVWSDNSNTSHDTTSSADWTNGFLVNTLRSPVQTISY